MIKRYLVLGLTAIVNLCAFEEKPWIGNLYEFYLDSSYEFYRFVSVADARGPVPSPWNNNLLTFDLGFSPLQGWDVQVEIELAATRAQSFGRRSAGLEVRKLWLDDIIGDAISLTTGLSARQTSTHSLRDISCPSAAKWDFEFNTALGKEWSCGADWCNRLYGVGAVGIGTFGAPWLKGRVVYQMQQPESFGFECFANGYFGFGPVPMVSVRRFHGWGPYDHSSVDLGAGVRYDFGMWGYLRLDYAYRVYAKVYPERVNSILLFYHIPFSLF